jgi:hypothetical protein
MDDIEALKLTEIATVELTEDIQLLFDRVNSISSSEVYLIGSSTRKLLNNETQFSDFDFVGTYDFDQLEDLLGPNIIGRDDDEEVIKVKIGEHVVDLIQSGSLVEALNYRDITLSLLCLRGDGKVFDPLDVYSDLQKGVIRMFSPQQKLEEDPSRLLRLVRFSADLGFIIDEETLIAAQQTILEFDTSLIPEIQKILSLSPEKRKNFLSIADNVDIGEQIRNTLSLYGEHLIMSDIPLSNGLEKIRSILAENKFYLFGGTIRDVVQGRKFKDIDLKVDLDMFDFATMLEKQGFSRTEDTDLPENTYFFNERFKAISIRIEDMVYDFTTRVNLTDREWYLHNDINFNTIIFSPEGGTLSNRASLPETILGILSLTEIDHEQEIDPLKIVNFFKQISRNSDLYVEPLSMEFATSYIPILFQYF